MGTSSLLKLQRKMQKTLDEDRYQHTLGVMYTSAALAMCYGEDLQKAQLAGLLHDCAKCIPNDQKIRMCREYGLEISKVEMEAPYLLHSKLGAYLARAKYGVNDEDVLGAILWHTTGRPNMTTLEKIVFIADYIEPARNKAQNLDQVRKLAFYDLNLCVCQILEDTLHYLDSGKGEIDPMSRSAYRYYHNLFYEIEDKGNSLTV